MENRRFFTVFIPVFLLIGLFYGTAQMVKLTGTVKDSTAQPLTYANLLAIPNDNTISTSFAITDENGTYTLNLVQNTTYTITISFLGYSAKEFVLTTTTENGTKDFVLNENATILDEVVLEYKIPIVVKEDTIIYNANAFATGEERKLRDLLKKLPGVEVSRDGSVEVRGKKVSKILVEDKTFFTGSSKLAINNIPANAVDKVEVLDNYNSVGFLKGLQDSDQMIINLRLKENKKRFAFGDIEVGAGIKDRYKIHPTLFYYSPKTTVNLIGDLNNIGEKSFTTSDYVEFEGGFGKLISDIGGYLNLLGDDFSNYLRNNDFTRNTDRFGAFNLRQSINKNTDLNSYVIVNESDTETSALSTNNFLNNELPFIENRSENQQLNNLFVIAKVAIESNPNKNTNFSSNSLFKYDDNKAIGTIQTNSPQNNTFLATNTDGENIDFKQSFAYNKKISKAQTLSLEGVLESTKNDLQNNWRTDDTFFENFIPVEIDSQYNILQQKESRTTHLNILAKDYWVLNRFNHIYTTFGSRLIFENYNTEESQLTTDNRLNDFSVSGYGNDVDYTFNDTFLGIEYRALSGIFTVKPSLFYHRYSFKNEQSNLQVSTVNNTFLPVLDIVAKINSSEKFSLKFKQDVRYPNSNRLINNFTLSNFDRIYRGQPNLTNERFERYSISYSKFSLFRGLTFVSNVFYNRKTQSIKNVTELDGISRFSTPILFNTPENSWIASLNFSKKIREFKFSYKARGNYNEFFQLLNSITTKNISKGISMTTGVETFFKKAPNVEVGYTFEPSNYRSAINESNFRNNALFFNIDYHFLKGFHFNADYSRSVFENESIAAKNRFDVANANLLYQKPDSKWGFEVNVRNIFDVKFKRQSSFNSFLISDRRTFLLPRIIMFKVNYRL